MKHDYKTAFWTIASLLVAFCACAAPPVPNYKGTFTGLGVGAYTGDGSLLTGVIAASSNTINLASSPSIGITTNGPTLNTPYLSAAVTNAFFQNATNEALKAASDATNSAALNAVGFALKSDATNAANFASQNSTNNAKLNANGIALLTDVTNEAVKASQNATNLAQLNAIGVARLTDVTNEALFATQNATNNTKLSANGIALLTDVTNEALFATQNATNGLPRGVTASGSAVATTNGSGVVNIGVTGAGGDVLAAGQNNFSGSNYFGGSSMFVGITWLPSAVTNQWRTDATNEALFATQNATNNTKLSANGIALLTDVTNEALFATQNATNKSVLRVNATNIDNNLQIANFNAGTSASSSTFWRGDGTWQTPASGGTGIATNNGTGTGNTFTNVTLWNPTNQGPFYSLGSTNWFAGDAAFGGATSFGTLSVNQLWATNLLATNSAAFNLPTNTGSAGQFLGWVDAQHTAFQTPPDTSGIATNSGTGLGNTFTNATLWNGTNNGNAFTSPGSGANSEQFGQGGKSLGINSTVLGNGAIAAGTQSTAIGSTATATNTQSFALGYGSTANGQNALAIGASAKATNDTTTSINGFAGGNGSTAVGYGATVFTGHTASTAIGYGAASTGANQIMLGRSNETVVVPGPSTFAFAATTTSSSATAPALNELVDSAYVLSVLGSVNLNLYFSAVTNSQVISTNPSPLYTMVDAAPPSAPQTNTIANANIPAGGYFLNRIETNVVALIQNMPVILNTYASIGGNASQSVTAHPEIWLLLTNGTFVMLGSAADVTYTQPAYPAPTPVTVSISLTNTTYLSTTLASGSKVMLRWWSTAKTATATWSFYVGSGYASRITLGGRVFNASDYAFLANNQTFTGTNTFTATINATVTNATTAGTATSTTDTGTYWGGTGTNTLILNNKYYYLNAAADCAITNLTTGGGAWAVLAINNTNAATTIHCYSHVGGIMGTVAYTANTNGLVVAAGKTAVYSFMSLSKTNYSNAVQQ